MIRRRARDATTTAILLLASALGACTLSQAPESVEPRTSPVASAKAAPEGLSAERDGLVLEADLRATTTELIAEVVVRNEGPEPVHLVPDQCGRVTEVFLVRTAFQPEGRRWDAGVQAVKDIILRDQLSRQGPERFHPPTPPRDADIETWCPRPEAPIALAPGEERVERWTLPLRSARALDEVGSEASAVRAAAVEATSPDELEFLSFLPPLDDDVDRAARSVMVERPAAEMIRTLPSEASGRMSLGEIFDALIAGSAELKAWVEAQPADGWRSAELTAAMPEYGAQFAHHRLRLVTTGFERAAAVLAAPDGSIVSVDLPGPEDRTRQFARRPATLPPGITLIPEPEAYVATEDLLLPELVLPSGRLVVGEYLLENGGLDVEASVPPGRYPVHATLGHHGDGDVRVALATLTASSEPTVRWEEAGVIAVDGGSTAFISTEARDALIAQFDADQATWDRFWFERVWDSHVAHDYLATEISVEGETNLAYFSSGIGDGGYPVYVGYDAADRPTQIVVDFVIMHLDWPVRVAP